MKYVAGVFFFVISSGFAAIRPESGEVHRLFDWPGEDGGYNIRMTKDGGYVIAGNTADEGGNRDMLVLRLRSDLEPDSSFGNNGRVQVGGTGEDQAADVLEVWNEKDQCFYYLVVGQSDRADRDFEGLRQWGKIDTVVMMLDQRGELVPFFGENGTGIRFYGTTEDDEPIVHRHNYSEPGERLVQTEDGFIVSSHARAGDGDLTGISIAGIQSGRDVFLFKIDERGEFVESWADGGIFLFGTSVGSQDRQQGNANDFIFSIQVHEDGALVGGGYTLGKDITLNERLIRTIGNNDGQGSENAFGDTNLYKMDGMFLRLKPDGRLDSDWGTEGVVFIGGTRQEKMYDVAMDSKGRYLLTGRTTSYDLQMYRPADQGGEFDMLLCRLKRDGSLDDSFGVGGKLILAGSKDDQALRVVPQLDGNIVFLGQSSSTQGIFGLPGQPSVFRQSIVGVVSENGKLLKMFSIGLEGEEKPSSFVVHADGRVVTTGFRLPNIDYEYDKAGREIAERCLWVHSFQL